MSCESTDTGVVLCMCLPKTKTKRKININKKYVYFCTYININIKNINTANVQPTHFYNSSVLHLRNQFVDNIYMDIYVDTRCFNRDWDDKSQ